MSMNDTQTTDNQHDAVNRMFDLVRSGDTGCAEYAMLDAMILAGLQQAYGEDVDTVASPVGMVATAAN